MRIPNKEYRPRGWGKDEKSPFVKKNFRRTRKTNSYLYGIHAVKKKVDLFEINSGAISRGYKKSPYPDVFILKELNRIGGKVILTSDCHNKDFLDCGYETSIELLKGCGFSEVYTIGKNGFEGNII